MDSNGIHQHYKLLKRAKAGILPDGRSKLGKSISTFRGWLRGSYGDSWNDMQQAREALMIPWLCFWLTCPMTDKDGHLLGDYVKSSKALEKAIMDIARLAEAEPKNIPNLRDYLRERESK